MSSFFKKVAHIAVKGAIMGAQTIEPGGPITFPHVVMPLLLGAGTMLIQHANTQLPAMKKQVEVNLSKK